VIAQTACEQMSFVTASVLLPHLAIDAVEGGLHRIDMSEGMVCNKGHIGFLTVALLPFLLMQQQQLLQARHTTARLSC
jgi:hypothetical protein